MASPPARPLPQPSAAPDARTTPQDLRDDELEQLEQWLDRWPAPGEPLALSALDGYLCGVLLQPRPVPATRWLRWVADSQGRPPPPGAPWAEVQALVLRRHAVLEQAIARRDWFDPWVFGEPSSADDGEDPGNDDDLPEPPGAAPATDGAAPPELEMTPAPVQEALAPWVAGFAAAMEHFPQLMDLDDRALLEPLAIIFLHVDPAMLEDADELLAVIETLEPPPDLGEAVQDLVRAVMLMADVTRPAAPGHQVRPAPGRQVRPAPGRQARPAPDRQARPESARPARPEASRQPRPAQPAGGPARRRPRSRP